MFHMIQNEMWSGAHMHRRIKMNQNVFGVRCSFTCYLFSGNVLIGACILSIWHSAAFFFPTLNSLTVQARFFFDTFFSTRPLNTGEKNRFCFFSVFLLDILLNQIGCARAHITYHGIQFRKELHFLLLFFFSSSQV